MSLFLGLALVALSPPGDDTAVDYGRDVQPILSAHCYQCHGPDAQTRKARLRLDRGEEALAERRGGAVLVPGQPEQSGLVQRIESDDPDEVMPPPEAKHPLSEAQKQILRRWVEQGASFTAHWAFVAPSRPELPAVQQADWPRQPLDHFVLARLEAEGLAPSPEADRRTLARRVFFVLTGLPPTPAEVEAFVADPRPDAYERLVDELLTRPAHAERMTLAWMDAARYGDTSVFHADGPRDMWPWRDWAIDAYARNLPFDRFTVLQLAGDLLPDGDEKARIATGFHRNHGTTDEGGVIAEEYRVEYVVDRVKTTANVWMGLTMECAQCHDHKYDPISQREYYQFFAFFNQAQDAGMQTRNGNAPPLIEAPTPDLQRRRDEAKTRLAERQEALALARAPQDELNAWIAAERAQLAALDLPTATDWLALGPFTAANRGEAFQVDQVDPAALDLTAEIEGKAWTPRPDLTDGKAHVLPIPGNSSIYFHRSLTAKSAGPRSLSLGSDDALKVWLNGELALAKDVSRGVAPDQDRVDIVLREGENHLLLKVTNGGGPAGVYYRLTDSTLPEPVLAALRTEDCGPGTEPGELLREYFTRNRWEPGIALVGEVQGLEQGLAELERSIPTVMVMANVEQPRQTFILNRGQYDQPLKDQPVDPGTPAMLPPMDPAQPRDRLGLARWIVDPRHPLTARVAVNRYWSLVFGRGLVETAMDFGAQGARPSHPALLDWLATDFVASGWDVRDQLRKLVSSATFRQASMTTPELLERDPRNLLLARSPRLRLQGEFVRDQALAVSGLLVDQVGGPGVKPYQPDGLWNEVSLNRGLRFQRDQGDKLYRKSMYIYWKRSAPMPVMTLFDAPTREKCVVQRSNTNTPLQALVTLNDVQFVEAARHLAQRMLTQGGERFETRLDLGFVLTTARPADELRRTVFREVYDATLAEYRARPEAAAALLAQGESPRDESLDPAEHAAWTVLASMLLNLDETLNRE